MITYTSKVEFEFTYNISSLDFDQTQVGTSHLSKLSYPHSNLPVLEENGVSEVSPKQMYYNSNYEFSVSNLQINCAMIS